MRIFTKERRRADRKRIRIDALIVVQAPALTADCAILDISLYGARVETAAAGVPDAFYLVDVVGAVAYQAVVVWRQGRFIGVRFRDMMLLADRTTPSFLKQVTIARPDRVIEPSPRGIYRTGDWSGNERS